MCCRRVTWRSGTAPTYSLCCVGARGRAGVEANRFFAEEAVRSGFRGKLTEHLIELRGRAAAIFLLANAEQAIDLDGIGDFGEQLGAAGGDREKDEFVSDVD